MTHIQRMTAEQAATLKQLAKAAYELDAFKPNLTRAEADIRIAMLKAKLNRQKLAGKFGAIYGRSCEFKTNFSALGAGTSPVRPPIGGCPRPLVDAHPAVRREPLLRQEPALVVHLARAAHPIAEIDVGKLHPLRPDDVIEDHERAQRPRRIPPDRRTNRPSTDRRRACRSAPRQGGRRGGARARRHRPLAPACSEARAAGIR